jgi:SAM-dependent methyltransferase
MNQTRILEAQIKTLEAKVTKLEREKNALVETCQKATALSQEYKLKPVRQERVRARFLEWLDKHEHQERHLLLEVGGRRNCFCQANTFDRYLNLDIEVGDGSEYIMGDITKRNAAVLDNTVDCVYSHDVFEHLNQPFDAAKEMFRMLRPGGLVFVDTLFAWREHGIPHDYFRYTIDGLVSVFTSAGFVRLETEYDYTERRRNILGRESNRVMPDALGGFRENIRVRGLFRKPTDYN